MALLVGPFQGTTDGGVPTLLLTLLLLLLPRVSPSRQGVYMNQFSTVLQALNGNGGFAFVAANSSIVALQVNICPAPPSPPSPPSPLLNVLVPVPQPPGAAAKPKGSQASGGWRGGSAQAVHAARARFVAPTTELCSGARSHMKLPCAQEAAQQLPRQPSSRIAPQTHSPAMHCALGALTCMPPAHAPSLQAATVTVAAAAASGGSLLVVAAAAAWCLRWSPAAKRRREHKRKQQSDLNRTAGTKGGKPDSCEPAFTVWGPKAPTRSSGSGSVKRVSQPGTERCSTSSPNSMEDLPTQGPSSSSGSNSPYPRGKCAAVGRVTRNIKYTDSSTQVRLPLCTPLPPVPM